MIKEITYLSFRVLLIMTYFLSYSDFALANREAEYVKFARGSGMVYFKVINHRGRYCSPSDIPNNIVWYQQTGTHRHLMEDGSIITSHNHCNGIIPTPAKPPIQVTGPSPAQKAAAEAEARRAEAARKAEAERRLEEARKAELRQAQDEAQLQAAIAKDAQALEANVMNDLKTQENDLEADLDSQMRDLEAKLKEQSDKLKAFCFPAETPISVKDDSELGYHSVPISSIRVGDSVVNCNLTIDGGTCEIGRVQKTITSTTDHLIKLTISGQILKATDNHPFYVVDRKNWVEAQDLRVGDRLLGISGGTLSVENTEIEEGDVTVYNLDIEGNHNYYACGVLVHNCNTAVGVLGTVATEAVPILERVIPIIGAPAAIPMNAMQQSQGLRDKFEQRKAKKEGPGRQGDGATKQSGDQWSREPKSIQDQMALDAAKKGAGQPIVKDLKDPRYKGMEKWEYRVKSTDGKDSVVHWVRDPKTSKLMDFKFKKHSTQ